MAKPNRNAALARAQSILSEKKAAGKRNINQFTSYVFTIGTASAFGYARGRNPELMTIADTEVEIPIALASAGLAFANVFGQTASHALHGLGMGSGSALGTLAAYELGRKHRAEDAARRGQVTQLPNQQRVAV